MKAMVLGTLGGPEKLRLCDRPQPSPGPGEVIVRLRAASLNFRDTLILKGGYGARQKTADLVPLSDGAGEVIAVGHAVKRWLPGDRVTGCFFQDWLAGEPSEAVLDSDLGRARDGVLAEFRAFGEQGLVATPAPLSDIEAAALPCAALTAWSALVTYGGVRAGDVVLVQGTGGVSLFALQFAKACGARVIVTSSSDAKLERAAALGADCLINYASDQDWGKTALQWTGGRGVDNVVEVGGAGTLKQSIRAVRPGGIISLIGVLAGARSDFLIPLIGSRNVCIQGIAVGHREGFEAMLRAMAVHRIKPVIDRVFALADAAAAFDHLAAGRHFGKVCIAI
ncbi:MAG: NAD(P)-dependent alcohol dehydrogenase [Alphaproteobacteria bacterium]|nr:NAD(P)-dependent alcohol dehydrogenase [Alphaproteobacteria bacterium]